MTKKLSFLFSILIIASVVLASCTQAAPTEEAMVEEPAAEEAAAEEAAPAMTFCQVTDTGGIDDKSFNATAWAGMEQAAADFGVTVKYLESQQQSDYEVNLNSLLKKVAI
jgi:basic membrane protein A